VCLREGYEYLEPVDNLGERLKEPLGEADEYFVFNVLLGELRFVR